MKTTAARPSWDEYFLNVAKAISTRSTCLRRKYGAVIVDTSNAIVSTGYNGSPVGEENCSDYGECKREELHVPKGERYELCKAVHAEQNAIINCTKQRMIGSTIYIYGENADGTLASGAPCLLCGRMIKNAGIARVVASTPIGGKKVDCAPKPSGDQALDQLGIMEPKIRKLFDDDNMIKGWFELKASDESEKRGICVNLDSRVRDDIIHKLYMRYGNIGCRRIVDVNGLAGDAYELEVSNGVILSIIFDAHDPECLYGKPSTVENIDQEVDKLVKTFTDAISTTSLK